ncbi:MAG: GGDEF domain-containing phosphodiesterase [Eubacteriales bacterium]
MDWLERCDVILDQHQLPCFLADVATRRIFYANGKLAKMFGGKENLLGKIYQEAITDDNATVTSCTLPNWDVIDFYEMEIYNNVVGHGFRVNLTIIKELQPAVIFCSLAPVGTKKRDEFSFEQTITQCITALQGDVEQKTNDLLEILGKYYEAEKTYLYMLDTAKEEISCENSWKVNPDVTITPALSQKIDVKILTDWLAMRNEVNIVEAARGHLDVDEKTLSGQVLNAFEIDDVVVSVVEDKKRDPLALIAVTNRKRKSADLRLLQSVSRFIEPDVTQSEEEHSIELMNDRDILTGFYNRTTYARKVEELQANPPKSIGVFLANVNGLRKINAEYGYAKGDSFIKKAAEIIKEYFKTTIYRIAGDEFVAFFPDVEKEKFENTVLALREKLKQDDSHLFALGHAWGNGRFDCGKLIRESDTMMYINKQEYYHTSNRRYDEISDSTLSDLLSFLDDKEFMVYLQPQVRLKDSSLYGAEALIRRFDKKNNKMVFPDQFIPLYEQKSVIRHVDLFVVEEVCQLLAAWTKHGKEIPISVNLSRVTLQEYGIVETIVEICDKYAVPHELLVIEVTERVGLIENNVASALISAFKVHGFNISLDDFGCAYSNIVTLAQIQVDEVKIDKSLVDNLTTNKQNHILVKNVLTMCNELDDTSTLAEGIEDEHQAKMLHELGCHLGQGYFYSRPIPVSEFEEKYI